MPIPGLDHSWELTPREAIVLQGQLASRVILAGELSDWSTLAAADVSFDRGSPWISAAVVVLKRGGAEPIAQATSTTRAMFPYVPGLLSFREIPALLPCFKALDVGFDVVLCDGQGRAHPRRLGLASHLGLWLDRPTIGCAKSCLIGEYQEPGPERGDRSPLVDQGEVIGDVLRTRRRAGPLFISPGHRCTREAAVALVLECLGRHRAPWPARLAHELANEARRRNALCLRAGEPPDSVRAWSGVNGGNR